MDIVELFIDEEDEVSGIEAVSIVENPAIEEDFIALKNHEVKFAEVNKEKRILMGAALIPNKPIYRKTEDKEYYIYFSRDTVRKASELFFIRGNYDKSTLEHGMPLNGLVAVESWLVEDSKKDKSAAYGMDMPIGTWMLSMKVLNDDVWNDYVKTGKVKGFSIEGYFADRAERPNEPNELAKIEEEEAEALITELKQILAGEELESYADYPDAVSNNAKRGIELNEKVNNKCATQVGKVRATQLAKKEPITVETIKRMFSYLSRAGEYYDESDNEACGTISYLLWGGKAGLRWAGSKLKELDLLEASLKKPCEAGYEMIGFKMKNGRRVPNCVPINAKSELSKVELNDYQRLNTALKKAQTEYEKALKQVNTTAANTFARSEKKFLELAREFKELEKKAIDLGAKDAAKEFAKEAAQDFKI